MSLTDYSAARSPASRSFGVTHDFASGSGNRGNDGVTDSSAGPAKQPAVHHRVLICEDQKDAAETYAAILRLSGHDVLVCFDGASAIAQAEKSRPTAAIIDIGLPGVTGYAVAQHIRRLPFGAGVLLIAITGYAKPADIEMARHAGFDWHFAKPAHPSFVLEVLEDPKREPMTRRDGTRLSPTD
jgi:CheY-like chemotaxis protein